MSARTTAGCGEATVTGLTNRALCPVSGRCVGEVPPRGRGAHEGGSGGSPPGSAQLLRGFGAAVGQELAAACRLVVLTDRGGGGPEHVQGPEEAAVGLVRPGHRAVAAPARPAKLVEPAVVPGPGVRVRGNSLAVPERPLGQGGPGGRGRWEAGRDIGWVLARSERLVRLGVGGEIDRRGPGAETGPGEQVIRIHAAPIAVQAMWWPTDSRSSQACTTRSAMPCSPALPQARGS